MEHKNLSKKSFVLAIVLSVVILCGMIFFAASSGMGNAVPGARDFEDMCRLKEIELTGSLSNFDKVADAKVLVQALDNEVSMVCIAVFMKEEMDDSEKSYISEFVSEYFEGLEEEKIELQFIPLTVS